MVLVSLNLLNLGFNISCITKIVFWKSACIGIIILFARFTLELSGGKVQVVDVEIVNKRQLITGSISELGKLRCVHEKKKLTFIPHWSYSQSSHRGASFWRKTCKRSVVEEIKPLLLKR